MTIQKFTLETQDTEIKRHFNENGFVIFKDLPFSKIFSSFQKEVQYLVKNKTKNKVSENTPLEDLFKNYIKTIHQEKREDFVHILDAAATLPSFYKICGDGNIQKILQSIGFNHISMTMPPRLRMDFPNEDEYILPDHQDHYYNEGDQEFVVVWIPLVTVENNMGGLGVRPKSHKEGLLPRYQISKRPYIYLEPGEWESKYPNQFVFLEIGEALVFHMDLIHKSGKNRGSFPRATIQLRYNNLEDPNYKAKGWPPSYKIYSKKDHIK